MKRKFALGALRLSSTKLTKDDDPNRTELSPTSPVSDSLLTPTDPHPPAPHRRSKLDPTVEIELRRACAIILRDLKPSGHDLEDTRMKQDILVEGGTPPLDEVPSLPAQNLPVHRSGQRALALATARANANGSAGLTSGGSSEASWPLSQSISNVSGTKRSRQSYEPLAGHAFSADAKARVDALMGATSGPTSPLREEYASGLAPTQTRTIGSPVTGHGDRPLSGYLLEDYFQAPENAMAPNANTESLSSNGSSVTNHTGSTTNHARSVSTELSSTAFTTPALASNRGSANGATATTTAWPSSAERKTFDTVEEGEQDGMSTEEKVEAEPETEPQEQEQEQEANRSLSMIKPLSIKEVQIPSRRPSAVPATGVKTEEPPLPPVPASLPLPAESEVVNEEKMEEKMEVEPLSIPIKETSTAQDEVVTTNGTTPAKSVEVREDMTAPLVELPVLPEVDYNKPLPPIELERESAEAATKEADLPSISDDEWSKIKALKLANIKDKSDEPLAMSRARMSSRPVSLSSTDALAFINYAASQSTYDPTAESSYLSSDNEATSGQTYTNGSISPAPEPAVDMSNKTHQWPITAPLDKITPVSDSPPTPVQASPVPTTPLVASPMEGTTTHQQDNTVYVKDFWRPTSPSRPRSRMSHFSAAPSVQSREMEMQKPVILSNLKTDMAAAAPASTGPISSIFNNPRSATPDRSPVMPKTTRIGSIPPPTAPINVPDSSKSLPPLPRPAQAQTQDGYFPNTAPIATTTTYTHNTTAPSTTPSRSQTSTSYTTPNTSTLFQPPPPQSSANNLSITPATIPTTNTLSPPPAQTATLRPPHTLPPPSSQPSISNLHPRTASALSNRSSIPTMSMSLSNQNAQNATLKSLSHRNIPPYIPGYGHVDPAAIAAMKRQSGIIVMPGAGVGEKQKGIKGLLFKLGGGDMPGADTGAGGAGARRGGGRGGGGAATTGRKGEWRAPPLVSLYGFGGPEEDLYEDDYDELACAAPVVPFGRGW